MATDLIRRYGADGTDMHAAMAELAEVYGLQIAWFGTDVAEIRWLPGLALGRGQVARPAQRLLAPQSV